MAVPVHQGVRGGTATTTAAVVASLTVAGNAIAAGDVVVVHVVQDGTGADLTLSSFVNVENLAGTSGAMTSIGAFAIGSPTAAKQHIWIGRVTTTSDMSVNVNSSSGDDMYTNAYAFRGVHTGTTLSDVIENGSAGTATNGVGTSTTVADTGVTTLGTDRLALQFIGIDDDSTGLAAFAGESGGDWTLPSASYQFESTTGTDATIALFSAAMASAGTINGGTDAITSDNWGVVGFALIPPSAGGTTYTKAGFGKESA